MIHVIATIELIEGKTAAFLEEFRRLVPQVRAEKGCLEYGPAVDLKTDIPVQSPGREHAVTVIEKWADLESLQAHLKSPHMAEYRTKVQELVKSVRLQILQPA